MNRAIHRVAVLMMLVAGSGAGAAYATDAAAAPALSVAPPAAHWVDRKLDYTYMGFTTKFSCDGLRDTVQQVLVALGARKKGLNIRSQGCTNFNGVEQFPGITATFSVLVPVTPDDRGKVGDNAALPTQWSKVDLVRLTRSGVASVPCELLEQLKDKALPLFTNRNLEFRSTCVPHQSLPGEITFNVDVLKPAPAPKT